MNIIKLILFLMLILQLMNSCNEPTGGDSGCPFPPLFCSDDIGDAPVFYGKSSMGRSLDNQKLALLVAYRDLEVYDIKTGQIQKFDFSKYLPANVKYIAVDFASWCPYNSNRLLVIMVTNTDTIGNGKVFTWGINGYIISLDGSEFKRVTPKQFGLAASEGLSIGPWLKGSSFNNDSFVIGGGLGIYLLQKDTIIPPGPDFKLIRSYSPNGRFYQTAELNKSTNSVDIYVNNRRLNFPDKFYGYYPSWSPDSKKLCLSVGVKEDESVPCKNRRFNENWIIDIEKWYNQNLDEPPGKIINQRKQFCMYSYGGGYGEFLTDTTLAISMYAPDGKYSYIWEVSVNGYLIKQLTTMP